MDLLEAPVSALPKIGPRYKFLLEKIGVTKVKDLLYHIPFRYDDYSIVKPVSDWQPGETGTMRAVLGSVDNIFTKYGKRLTKASAIDSSGKISLVWFNQHYLKKTLTVGATYLISGRISLFDRKPAIFSPELEEEKEGSLNHGRFVPIYPETEGITSKWLRSRINDVLNGGKFPADIIPGEIKNKYDLKNLEWCLQKIHFPDELGQVKISRYRLGFEELFLDLLNIEARKKEWASKKNGFVINKHREKLNKLVSKLPFTLTDSQSKVLEDILHDFSQPHPMNRLLEGDVGTGKTIVALLAAYLAHLNGYKTVYLAPTEILAQQHYETFNKFLEGTGVNIGLTTSATKNGDGSSDIEIGTHALLYRPKIFEKVALLIIDEQHRFGVEQRTQLSTLAKTHKTPHVLTMTATPIPRTLALTMYGDLSLSVLKTHPHAERKITTKVVPENHREEVYNWIKKHNQPTFIVCPFVEESDIESLSNVKAAEKEYENLKKGTFADMEIGLIHGRMKSKEKQEAIEKFKKGEIKVLVSTPVIEVGIDIPDASVMLIESAERYGLASLHQLRGRVGRGFEQGYCFVFMSAYSSKAYARLKNLESVDDGLKLAEIDLKMRGQGDIFSTMQHGFKQYKIASLDDFVLIERAKLAAEEVFGRLVDYPELEKALDEKAKGVLNN